MQEYLRSTGKKIGFVPTMGALHAGHLALIETSKKQCELTVCSIFVNPTQFNDPTDFAKYPKTLTEDIIKLESVGCDVVYIPDVADLYPDGMQHLPHYSLGQLENLLEGKHRIGHFQGVCIIVHRLLDAVTPHQLFMGQKDYQQIAVIRKLLDIIHAKIELFICPTSRETSGLAMSSRNTRLNPIQREQATAIFQGFQTLERNPTWDGFGQTLLTQGFQSIDYIAFCDPDTLEEKTDRKRPFILLIAASISNVRLLDNYLFI